MGVRAGILGYGLAGRLLHSPLIADAGIEVAAIATKRIDEANSDFPDAIVEALPEAVIARDDLDLIVVATPSFLHAPHARDALESGKHVVIEKPFATSSAEALALVKLAAAKKRLLCCFQNRRWDADFLTVRKLLAEGLLGDISLYQMRWDRYRPARREDWRDGEVPGAGAVFDLGSHLIDQALALFGTPDWLQADLARQRENQFADDCFEIRMGKGEMRISLGSSTLAADGARFMRLLGKNGAFYKAGLDPQEPKLRAREKPSADFGVEDEAAWGRITTPDGAVRAYASEAGDWRSFYRAVRASIETGAPAPVPSQESARLIGVIEAVFESAKTGQRVELPGFLRERGL